MIELTVNGDRRTVGIPAHYTLLETLRYALGLTGSKQGCDKGDCGACTVLLDDVPTLSCITPVHEAAGRRVRTVEGLVRGPGGAVINYVWNALAPAMEPVVQLCSSGALERHPNLKFATVEAGIGWIPWTMHVMDEDEFESMPWNVVHHQLLPAGRQTRHAPPRGYQRQWGRQ